MVSSLSVLRESPVNGQRERGAGNRSHSGFRASVSAAALGEDKVAFISFGDSSDWKSNSHRQARFLPHFGPDRLPLLDLAGDHAEPAVVE